MKQDGSVLDNPDNRESILSIIPSIDTIPPHWCPFVFICGFSSSIPFILLSCQEKRNAGTAEPYEFSPAELVD